MAIRFKVGTIPVECDTADEAGTLLLEISRRIEPTAVVDNHEPDHGNTAVPPNAAPPQRPETTAATPTALRAWFMSLAPNQKQAMKLVRDTPNGVTTTQMAHALGCERNALKYAIRSLRGAATKARLEPDILLDSQEVRIDGEKGSRYVMSSESRLALADID